MQKKKVSDVPLSRIIVVGHVTIDHVIDVAGQVLPRDALGGGLCYSALCLRSLGYFPRIVTRVGEDFPPEYTKFLSSSAGIDIEEWMVKGHNTTSYMIDRTEASRKLCLKASCEELDYEDFTSCFEDGSHGKVALINSVAGEVSLQLVERIVGKCEKVFVDSQGFVRKFGSDGEVSMRSGMDISYLAGVDVLKADLEELTAWTGEKDKSRAIGQLSTFVKRLLVTSGPGLVEIYEHGSLAFKARPFRVEAKDTTGAGDIMLASFAARFYETNSISDALAFSIAASSLAVRQSGIEKAILNKRQVIDEMVKVEIEGRND